MVKPGPAIGADQLIQVGGPARRQIHESLIAVQHHLGPGDQDPRRLDPQGSSDGKQSRPAEPRVSRPQRRRPDF